MPTISSCSVVLRLYHHFYNICRLYLPTFIRVVSLTPGAIVWLRGASEEMLKDIGKIDQWYTKTRHKKEMTVGIFLGMWSSTHLSLDKMAAFSQTTFSNAFSWMKMYEFHLRFHWNLFLWYKLIIFQRQAITWTNADPIHWRIYAALAGMS